MAQINHEILSWSRQTAGLTLEEASRKLRFSDTKKMSAAEKLRSLEAGDSIPSKQTLENMAQVYRRPLIVFYLEKIPAEKELVTDFRRKKNKRNRSRKRTAQRVDSRCKTAARND